MATAAAAASEPHVARAAREVLAHGNAVDAVVAGVLSAAAESPAVLLGPVQVLVAGAGAGLCAIDGRVLQPGSGAPRPRGVREGEPVPAQARVGVPALPAALALAAASRGTLGLRRLTGPALDQVRDRSPERARVLEAFARRGAPAWTEPAVLAELIAAAGRAAGGVLTSDDLASVRPRLVACDERSLDRGAILRVPWRGAAGLDASSAHVVVAADGLGLVAAACYEAPLEGLPIPALGLVAPAFARPVMRGEPRARPGEPCPAAAPVAVRVVRGVADLAAGVAAAADAEAALDALVRALPDTPTIALALASVPAGRAVAVVRGRDAARVLASA